MNENDRRYSRRMRIIAVILLAVTGFTVVGGAIERGLYGAIEGVVLLYIAAVFAYGIFDGSLDSAPIQAAFGVGLAAYGGLMYLLYGGPLWAGLAVLGAVLTVYGGQELLAGR